MKPHDEAFSAEIDALLNEFRNKNITVAELMKLIRMAYGDYMEFHPEELPEIDERAVPTTNKPDPINKKE